MDKSDALEPKIHYQNIIMMRHGDRIDAFVKSWRSEAARPWDPHLIPEGHSRAISMGQKLRTEVDYPIHRVFVSPFLRCVETASGVISGLCNVNNDANLSKVKASIQYGLCEAFNIIAIEAPPKDGEDWGFNLSELETVFPVGAVDPTCEQVIAELPQWDETFDDARARFVRVIHTLADKYPAENLLLVTHGEAVRGVMNTFSSNVKCRLVDYCGYVQLRREVMRADNESFEAGKFELITDFSNGITHTTLNDTA